MTMMPKWKTCPKCRQIYSWNPDVGQTECPSCREKFMQKTHKLFDIIGVGNEVKK